MKVLQITFNLGPGGAERFVVDLSNELVQNNEVVILTLMDDQIEHERVQFYLFDLDKKVKYKNLGLKKGAGFSVKVLWKVYKAMKEEKADVIHLHVHGVVYFCFVGILLLCWRTIIVQTIHTDFKVGHSTLLYKFLFRTIGRLHKMRWVALSKTNYDDMKEAYPFLLCKRIDNGRAELKPTPQFYDVKKEIDSYKRTDKTVVFLHVARCVLVKNQSMLISAFNEIHNSEFDAILLIIGSDFDSELGKELQIMAGRGVYFLGTRKNIADYMCLADCFCLSSTYEGLPITILEALLTGTPVVSTPVKGAVDVIKDGITGVISKDFSKDSYIQALEKAIVELRTLKSNSELEKEKSPFTMSRCALSYLNFYKQDK